MTESTATPEAADALVPSIDQIVFWLLRDGWIERARTATSAIYVRPDTGDSQLSAQVMVPLSDTLTDYDDAVRAVIAKASIALDRREWLVREEMLAGDARDLVTVWSDSPEPGIVSLPIGAALFNGARGLVLASAASAIAPRSAFGQMRPDAAESYLHDVNATVYAGSFAVVLSCPLAPSSTTTTFPLGDPFGRQVTKTLARSMATAVELAQDPVRRIQPTEWAGTVVDGVSADLIDAVAQLAPRSDSAERSVGVQFSPMEPTDIDQRSVTIPHGIVEYLNSAAEHLRQLVVRVPVTVVGEVVSLERRPRGGTYFKVSGELIPANTWRRMRHATIQIIDPDVDEATMIEAFRLKGRVAVDGIAIRRGRSLVMIQVSGLSLADLPPEPQGESLELPYSDE